MEMTFGDYIKNPMGRNNAVLNATAREAMRTSYTSKFNALMVREHGIFKYTLFKDESNNSFYAWIKIPSETIKGFYYDTVIKFFTNQDVKEAGQNLLRYNVKFYSNDPSFVYTYAYVFSHNGLLIDELRGKMSSKALKDAAKEKNPYNQVGYVKSIYFAYLFLNNRGLFSTAKFSAEAIDIDLNYLNRNITDADRAIEMRQNEQEKLNKNKKKEKREVSGIAKGPKTIDKTVIARTKTTKSVSRVGTTKTISNVKKTKRK